MELIFEEYGIGLLLFVVGIEVLFSFEQMITLIMEVL